MTELRNGGPTGREFGAMRREVDYLLERDKELHDKIDEMPNAIVEEINKVRKDCPHAIDAPAIDKRLRILERFFWGCLGAFFLFKFAYPYVAGK